MESFLLTVPFYSADAETHGRVPFPFTFRGWLYARSSMGGLPSQQPGEATLWGNVPTVFFTCPASARVVTVELRYVDGQSFNYASPDLTLDSLIVAAPLTDPRLSGWAFRSALGKFLIDSAGKAKLTQFSDPSVELLNIMQTQVTQWTFSPPLVDGKPTAAELEFVLYLEDVGVDGSVTAVPADYLAALKRLRSSGFSSPIVVIHAFRSSSADKKWSVVAGGVHVESSDVRQKSLMQSRTGPK